MKLENGQDGPAKEAPETPEDAELKELYQEYLQKCCEAGQIKYNLSQLNGQQRELEKQLEVTERAVSSAAAKHRDLQKKKFSKIKPVAAVPTPKLGVEH